MIEAADLNRRRFLQIGAGLGAELVLGFNLLGCAENDASTRFAETEWIPNAWLRIRSDGTVLVMVAESEMGQGVMTALPMLIAEELQVPWKAVQCQQAPVAPDYGWQSTGGSNSIRQNWLLLRQVGALAREMLIAAAVSQWKVAQSECRAENGAVLHGPTERRLTYGELVATAVRLTPPPLQDVKLKAFDKFTSIGKPLPQLNIDDKLCGKAIYGIDVSVPDMLTAVIARSPTLGGKLISFDASRAQAVSGVKHIVPIDTGVAVVAKNTWSALQGREKLGIEWEPGANQALDTTAIMDSLRASLDAPAMTAIEQTNALAEQTDSHTVVQAEYQLPYQAHAPLEPMNATARVTAQGCEVWAPTQSPTFAQQVAYQHSLSSSQRFLSKVRQKLFGGTLENFPVHTTLLGGGFGRRLQQDYVAEAVQIAKAIDAPVKVLWTRDDDLRHDFYRPATCHRMRAKLGADKRILSWQHRVAGPGNPTRGAAELPYTVSHLRVDYVSVDSPLPIGSWRSVDHSWNAFAVESFMDELAHAAQEDPYAFRHRLLTTSPRHQRVLERVADKAGWGTTLPEGRYQGIAVHASFGTYVAQVAELSIDDGGQVHIHRVVCAIDCGIVINPNTVEAQIQGAIAFGLTAALKSQITVRQGGVKQSDFHDFPVLRMNEMPKIETHIIASTEDPGGVGEPGVPPIAPAVANAVFAATGVRVRALPIGKVV